MRSADIDLKLGRARTLLADFHAIAATIRNGFCTIKPEDDPKREMTVMRITIEPKAPDELRLIAGDLLFNLRASLDYVITMAVEANGKVPTRSNQFPIAQDAQSFQTFASKQLAGVSDGMRAAVEQLQPYHRGNAALRTLSKLHNGDKHQRLNLTAVVADSSHLQSVGAASPFSLISDIPLCDGGVFGNIGIPWALPAEFASMLTRNLDMRIEGPCTQFVGFAELFEPAEEEEGYEAAEVTLGGILKYIESKVLPAVLPHLN